MKILKLLLIVFIGFLGLGTLSACSQQKKKRTEGGGYIDNRGKKETS